CWEDSRQHPTMGRLLGFGSLACRPWDGGPVGEASARQTDRGRTVQPQGDGRSIWRALAAGALLLAMAACGTLFPPPDLPPGKAWFDQPLVASTPVSGLTLTVSYDAQTTKFRGLGGAGAGAIAAAHDDGTGKIGRASCRGRGNTSEVATPRPMK